MAQIKTVKLSRYDSTPWGFRLQGGKDFGTPLVIQKVNGGSLAEKAGLQVGDALLKVNNTDVSNLKHKDAQDVIVRSGNAFEFTIQRGGIVTSTWKPSVTPVGSVPPPPAFSGPSPAPVTKTSLTYKGPPAPHIGCGHNNTPHPFSAGVNGHDGKQLVNKQYNSPVGIYSEESIAETLSAQAEVLAGGVLGVNFKKNEKNYTPSNSEVLKMVQEADQAPRSPEPVASATSYFATHSHATGGRAVSPRPVTPCALGLGHAPARPSTPAHQPAQTLPQSLPQSANQQPIRSATPANQQTSYPTESPVPFDAPKCGDCSQPISGVFVRIKEKNLHVECFKCATCGTSLKNVGYYNINNKLYCDVHAKMVARQNPPGPGLEPVTVPFGKKPPANTISQALTSHSVAPKSPVGQSYQAPPSLPPYSPSPTSLSGPKPFGTPTGMKPASGANFGSPYKPVQSPLSPKFNQTPLAPKPIQSPLTKPKNTFKDLDPDKNTPPSPSQVQSPVSNGQTIGNNTNSAFAPVTKAQVEQKSDESPTKVEEALSPEKKALAMLSETISSTCLLRSIIEAEKRPSSPAVVHQTKREEDFTLPNPRPENQGIFDYATKMQPYYTRTTPVPHVDVHPPLHEIPHDVSSLLPPASLLRPLSPAVVLSFPPVFPALPAKPRSRCSSPAPPQHTPREERNIEPSPPHIPPQAVDVPQEPEEKPQQEPWVPPVYVPERAPEHVTDLPKCYETRGPLAEAMTTAPITPFSPVPFPEPIEIPSMKPLPPESTPVLVRPESPMLKALTVAPDRCYSPLPSITKPLESLTQLSDINKPVNLLFGEKEEPPKSEPCLTMLSALTIASDRPYSPIPAPPPPAPLPVVHHITDAPFETYVPKLPESKQADAKRTGKSDDKGSGKVQRSDDDPHHFPLTSSGLHIPATIPHYQEHIDEVPIHSMLRNSPLPMKAAMQESLTIQSKIMNILTQQDTSCKTTAISAEPLKPSALDFLKQKDDSTKIIPILGYKPNSLIDSKKGASQVAEKEGSQIVHEEKTETIESFSSESVTKTSVEKRSEISQVTQEKVCQQLCQSQCQSLPQCQKAKETAQKVDVKPSEPKVRFEQQKEPVKEPVQKVDVKPSFEPKVRFERQNTFEPKASEPVFNGNPSSTAPSVSSELSRKLANLIPSMPSDPNPSSLPPNTGSGGGKGSSSGLTTAPRRGRGVLNPQNLTPGARVPQCGQCYKQIRGPFITALGKIWCPDHFTCVRAQCKRPLQDIGFVEEDNGLYCEFCFEQYLAPACYKCAQKIKGDCLNAIGRHYHPECFTCAYCGKLFGNNPFFLEEGLPYCENDWNDLFTTKCFACGFPIEAGDRWVEALSNNYHSLCFNCSVPSCKKNLEGQSFFAKAGRPFCKGHAR